MKFSERLLGEEKKGGRCDERIEVMGRREMMSGKEEKGRLGF